MSLEDIIMKKLHSYVNSSTGKNQVRDYIRKESKQGGVLIDDIKSELLKLQRCIQREISNYYSSYSPSVYDRTGNFGNSLVIESDSLGNMILTFDDSKAFHKSLFDDSQEVYVPILMDSGWSWHEFPTNYGGSAGTSPVYRFMYFDGTNYIDSGINQYLSTAPKGIKLSVKQRNFDGVETIKYYSK